MGALINMAVFAKCSYFANVSYEEEEVQCQSHGTGLSFVFIGVNWRNKPVNTDDTT